MHKSKENKRKTGKVRSFSSLLFSFIIDKKTYKKNKLLTAVFYVLVKQKLDRTCLFFAKSLQFFSINKSKKQKLVLIKTQPVSDYYIKKKEGWKVVNN
ncbi:hypothetical protein N9W06_01705 [Candidatus Marinimicrobia bacterium]|nr:hypothetical protein [Candidatus Neomarinimicrobiota bacterium]